MADARLLARRRGHDPYDGSPFGWYGAEPAFHVRVERGMRSIRDIAGPVTSVLTDRELVYSVPGLAVPGDLERHDLTIKFHRTQLPDWTLGIARCDYPDVFTSVDRPRKHQHSYGALCLWASYDPPEQRWWHGDGLLSLVEIARAHLFLELHWWHTGGDHGGEWVVPDAPHGLPDVEELR